jgi:hypothetical protein
MTTTNNRPDTYDPVVEAILQSIQQNETVHLPYDRDQFDQLLVASDDSVGAQELEFWGTHEGSDWRVHMKRPKAVTG